ncbi:hypothetical protein Tsubulata_026748 [Turnera subulata]|uniref:Uncharacterized protein n=1 Tax=Turnera subulata TaxID=218843 RepID=A0A9Q0F3D0_9ROSI|nr:hypothetical protein Tsubulata_026748 [Turnera subulata]
MSRPKYQIFKLSLELYLLRNRGRNPNYVRPRNAPKGHSYHPRPPAARVTDPNSPSLPPASNAQNNPDAPNVRGEGFAQESFSSFAQDFPNFSVHGLTLQFSYNTIEYLAHSGLESVGPSHGRSHFLSSSRTRLFLVISRCAFACF